MITVLPAVSKDGGMSMTQLPAALPENQTSISKDGI